MASALFISNLAPLIKVSQITTDNRIFQLHYKASTVLFFAFSIAVSGYQFFGDPILCMNNDDVGNPADGKANRILNNFCWVEGTFTLPKYLNHKVGEEVPHPGVHKYVEGDDIIEHAYYQWVWVVLFLIGCLSYVPRLLWKIFEGQKIKNIVSELYKSVLEEESKKKLEGKVVDYFISHKGDHSAYAFKFLLCEILNFVNVIFQMCLLNKFLGGEFFTYGSRVFEYIRKDDGADDNPMIRVFPRVSKCIFHRVGPSGSVMKYDVMCALPLNILNEKAFAAIWLWLILLSILSGLAIVYRIIVFVSPSLRFLLTKTYNYLTPENVIDDVLTRLSFGDWFVLYQVANNIDSIHFMELMYDLDDKLNARESMLSSTPSTPSSKKHDETMI